MLNISEQIQVGFAGGRLCLKQGMGEMMCLSFVHIWLLIPSLKHTWSIMQLGAIVTQGAPQTKPEQLRD